MPIWAAWLGASVRLSHGGILLNGRLRWSNVPLPESHLVLIVAGVALNALWPLAVGWTGAWFWVTGVILILLGAVIVVWATVTAGRVKLADPDHLIKTGPYRYSRHPMYMAWTVVYFGLLLVLDSAWLLILAPALAVWVHWESGREEKRLLDAFGSAYEGYRRRVRRYL